MSRGRRLGLSNPVVTAARRGCGRRCWLRREGRAVGPAWRWAQFDANRRSSLSPGPPAGPRRSLAHRAGPGSRWGMSKQYAKPQLARRRSALRAGLPGITDGTASSRWLRVDRRRSPQLDQQAIRRRWAGVHPAGGNGDPGTHLQQVFHIELGMAASGWPGPGREQAGPRRPLKRSGRWFRLPWRWSGPWHGSKRSGAAGIPACRLALDQVPLCSHRGLREGDQCCRCFIGPGGRTTFPPLVGDGGKGGGDVVQRDGDVGHSVTEGVDWAYPGEGELRTDSVSSPDSPRGQGEATLGKVAATQAARLLPERRCRSRGAIEIAPLEHGVEQSHRGRLTGSQSGHSDRPLIGEAVRPWHRHRVRPGDAP